LAFGQLKAYTVHIQPERPTQKLIQMYSTMIRLAVNCSTPCQIFMSRSVTIQYCLSVVESQSELHTPIQLGLFAWSLGHGLELVIKPNGPSPFIKIQRKRNLKTAKSLNETV